jgi:acyl-CoA reductase-like NAD-dependent aldehyde dehydrogenase
MATTLPSIALHPRMFIDGEWCHSLSGETADAVSPATGEVIGAVPQGDRADAVRAIEAARAAAEKWSGMTAFDRAARMHAVGDAIEARRHELALTLTLDQGKPLRAEAHDEVTELVDYWRMAAEDVKRLGGELPNSFSPGKRVMLVRRPRGVAGVISPWNWPYTMPAELIAPALACGNTVVWTPAPSTAVCAVALARCVAEADLPAGVFNLVTGPGPVVGDEIARNAGTDAIGFIGSTATGRHVASAAAGKAAVIEMGGNGPLVVMDDADIEAAVAGTLTACFLCAGQSCTAGERILVHRAVYDEYLERLASAVSEQVRLGDPFDDSTTMGPLNNEAVAAKMDEHVSDALARGARVLTGGTRDAGHPTDLFWQPTVLADVASDARVAVEETFGPVAPVVAIASLEQAIALTNASPYGLLSAIFTDDLARGLEFADRVRTGWVNINESSNYWESHLPFGGRAGSDSGIGRVGGAHVMDSFTELQTVVITPARARGRRLEG